MPSTIGAESLHTSALPIPQATARRFLIYIGKAVSTRIARLPNATILFTLLSRSQGCMNTSHEYLARKGT